MIKKINIIAFSFLFLLIFAGNAFSLDKREYHIELALGADIPIAKPKSGISPILYGSFLWYFDNVNMYTNLAATTTTIIFDVAYQKDRIHTGIMPLYYHTTYGAYRSIYKGRNDEDTNIKGAYTGADLYFKYIFVKKDGMNILAAKVSYSPYYFMYGKFKEDNFLDGFDSVITPPNDHFENQAQAVLTVDWVKKSDALGFVKHGIFAEFTYLYANRIGFGSFNDTFTGETSRIKNTHKMYLELGGYYRFAGDYTLKLEALGAWHIGIDRSNAEQIGSWVATKANMPGFFLAEFMHDRFVVGKAGFGIPTPVWKLRFDPAFNVLYMAENNRVIGAPDYPHKVYMSVSMSMSMLIANLVPFVVQYAYGINADRYRDTGSHEIMFALVAAFLKTDKPVGKPKVAGDAKDAEAGKQP